MTLESCSVNSAGFREMRLPIPAFPVISGDVTCGCAPACTLTDTSLANLALSTRSVPVLNVDDSDAANQSCGVRRTQNLFHLTYHVFSSPPLTPL